MAQESPGERRSLLTGAAAASEDDHADPAAEYATLPVPDTRTVHWFRVALTFAAGALSVPTFVAGIDVAAAAPSPAAAAGSIAAGNAILAALGAVMGSIGARTRLSSYVLIRVAFGERGSVLVNLAFALSLLGWFGVNVDLFSRAVVHIYRGSSYSEGGRGIDVPSLVIGTCAGIVMSATTMCGFRAISALSAILAPVLGVVTALLVAEALTARPMEEIIAPREIPALHEIGFGRAISSVVGTSIVGAIIMPDLTRFIRSWHGAVFTAIFAYGVSTVAQGAGGLASVAFEDDDLLDIMLLIGLGWATFAIIIAGTWVLNALNLYSATLSIEATLPGLESRLLPALLGAAGTCLAFGNILVYFLDFLFYLSIVFAPIAGVLAVDYLLRQSAYEIEHLEMDRSVNVTALLSWILGAVVALLASQHLITLTGIAAVDSILTSGVIYFVLRGTCHQHA